MKRRAVYFAALALVSVVAVTPTGVGALPRLAATSLRTAADGLSLVVTVRCYRWEFAANICAGICSNTPNDLQGYSYIWNTSQCKDNGFTVNQETCKTNSPNTVMSKITSCKASPGSYADTCIVTVCGVVTTPFAPKPAGRALRVTQPAPAPKAGPPGPGLLENDTGFVRQGPSAIGTPGGAGGRAPSGDSLRLR